MLHFYILVQKSSSAQEVQKVQYFYDWICEDLCTNVQDKSEPIWSVLNKQAVSHYYYTANSTDCNKKIIHSESRIFLKLFLYKYIIVFSY